MKRKVTVLFAGIVLLFAGNLFAQQDSTLYKIMRAPEVHLSKQVVVQGVIQEYIPVDLVYESAEESRTVVYILKGDFGDQITVKSHLQIPETNTKYQVTGMFQESRDPFSDYEIIETQRIEVSQVVEPSQEVVTSETWWNKYGLYVLIAAGVVLLLLIVIMIVSLTKKPASIAAPTSRPVPPPSPVAGTAPQFSSPSQFKTVKIAVNTPKTMRFIPGSLEIISGDDTGKTVKMVGYPTEKGSVVTLGRESVSGEEAFSHIQLQDQTVSRKQAEIIFRDGKLMIKNLSETNYTQVNGKELKPNETVELTPGSVIRTGAVEFKYAV